MNPKHPQKSFIMKVDLPEIPARYYLYLGVVLERENIHFKQVLESAQIDYETMT